MQKNDVAAKLGIQYPIIQAPMVGVSTPALVAAVSNAGGLGSLGLGASTIEKGAALIAQTHALTRQPFNVNVFCHVPATPDSQREAAWLSYLGPEFRKFGAEPPPSLPNNAPTAIGNDELLQMLVQTKPKVVSFHFGLPDAHWNAALHDAGIVTMACATNLDEALAIEKAGIDVIIAQGVEAGGHRGVFDPSTDDMIGTFALVRQLALRCSKPVIATGGIMDGAGIAAAMRLGAAGVQMGTAFILCPESSASDAYRAELKSELANHTAITSAISGRPARGIVNRLHVLGLAGAPRLPDYPITYAAARALHQAAARHGSSDYAAHWAGQGASLARELPAATLVAELVEEWRRSGRAD